MLIAATLGFFRVVKIRVRLEAPGGRSSREIEPAARKGTAMNMNIPLGKRTLAVIAAAGVTGATVVAAVAFTHHDAPTTVVQPVAATSTAAAMPDTAGPSAASSAAPRPTPSSVTPSVLSAAQASAIAERAARGQAEDVTALSAATGLTYSVSVSRADGTEAEVAVDAHSGRVLSVVAEAADSPNAPESEDMVDSPDTAPDPQDSADPQDTNDR